MSIHLSYHVFKAMIFTRYAHTSMHPWLKSILVGRLKL